MQRRIEHEMAGATRHCIRRHATLDIRHATMRAIFRVTSYAFAAFDAPFFFIALMRATLRCFFIASYARWRAPLPLILRALPRHCRLLRRYAATMMSFHDDAVTLRRRLYARYAATLRDVGCCLRYGFMMICRRHDASLRLFFLRGSVCACRRVFTRRVCAAIFHGL